MSKRDNGGAAFPTLERFEECHDERFREFIAPFGGMTLRDYFAGQTITGLIDLRVEANCPAIAKRAYEIADAMLAERAK